MTKAELKVFDELRLLIHALDKSLLRVKEQVTTLTHEVSLLKQQQRPVDAIGRKA